MLYCLDLLKIIKCMRFFDHCMTTSSSSFFLFCDSTTNSKQTLSIKDVKLSKNFTLIQDIGINYAEAFNHRVIKVT